MDKRAIIFDFFGVICSEIAPFWLARHFSASEAASVKSSIVHRADLGEISEEQMFEELSMLTRVPPRKIESEWFSYVLIDAGMLDLVRLLRHEVALGLLTNAPSRFVRRILNQQGLEDLFESVVVSSEVGCTKPEPPIYEAMLRALDVESRDALMIDDNPANVEGAVAVGMRGLLFESVQQSRAAIRQWLDGSTEHDHAEW